MAVVVVRFGDREIPQDELTAWAASIAGALHDAGVEHGDRVAIVLRNDPTFLALSAACSQSGAVAVPINWHSRGRELAHVLSHSGARVVFVHSDLIPAVEQVLPDGVELVEVPVPDELAAHYGEAALTGRHPVLDGWIADAEPCSEPAETARMSLIYTSGTTGLAKGVLREAMTAERSQEVVAATLAAMGLRPGMRTLITAPMYHAAPNSQGVFALALGIELTIMPRFVPESFLAVIEAQRITHAQVVPTMFVQLLELPDEIRARYDLSSLECVVHAAAPCPVHVKRRVIEWFGPVVLEYYGATEIGIVVACDTHEWLAHEGTVGKPLGGADIRMFDPAGKLLAPGETGEVYIRPPGYWPGFTYLDQEDRRREIDRDGYITIGDIGRVDEDGFLHLSDRARDMVISGGTNIYPAEIEACLLELDGVRDVAVFGIPDDEFGEALAAHIDTEPSAGLSESSIRQHVGTRLASFKMPKVVVFDDDLPREETGKIFKRRIRERYWARAGRNI
jgi:long-chain acyl-CoA synthetase